MQQLTRRVLEPALEGEITDHVGYEKHDPAGKNNGNSRNGTRSKTVLTDVGPVEMKVPRDTAGTFEPQIVKKRQRRLTGVPGPDGEGPQAMDHALEGPTRCLPDRLRGAPDPAERQLAPQQPRSAVKLTHPPRPTFRLGLGHPRRRRAVLRHVRVLRRTRWLQ